MKLLNVAYKPHNLYKELVYAVHIILLAVQLTGSLATLVQEHGVELQPPSKGLQRVRHWTK